MTHPLPVPLTVAPVGVWDRLAVVALGAAGCALSYDALQQMAVAIHVRGFLTYLFPLVIDGFIAYGVRALLVLSAAPLFARAYVWALFGIATSASIWANALHAVRLNQQTTQHGLRLGDHVVAVLSTLAPLALAGAVHLYILITRHHPADQSRTTPGADQRAWGTKNRTRTGTVQPTIPEMAPQTNSPSDQGDMDQSEVRHSHADDGTDQSGTGADQNNAVSRTMNTADHSTVSDEGSLGPHADAKVDQGSAAGSDGTDGTLRTSSTAGHVPDAFTRSASASDPNSLVPPADTADETNEVPPGLGGPADQEHRRSADRTTFSADQRIGPGTDREEQAADHPPADRSARPTQQRTEDRNVAPVNRPRTGTRSRTNPADGDQVPMEQLLKVAREGALKEGRMTRRALRPHLRKQNITISNERFSELQSRLYEDKALAHLPRSQKKTR
ncbi:DUF2637 domain-containing protein [Streptomyces sp. SID1121]|uniref:DUF2637 domain-containing protein n=1 Tax=Streptomyces sp. SID1121 TaxID=3425888 RepID=UPI0040570AD5